MEEFNFKDKKIALVTHFFSTGPSQEMHSFLIPKAGTLLYINHPFYYCEELSSSMELYKNGKLKRKVVLPFFRAPDLFFYIKDTLFTLWNVLASGEKYDIYIGADGLNAFAGLVLKRLKRVKVVVLYTIDYIPRRFKNNLLNRIYHFIDRVCCYRCDCIWNISEKISEGRFNNGVSFSRCATQIVVPNGNNFNKIKRLPFGQIDRYCIVFMGHLRKNQGAELIIEAMPDILKLIPQARLKIVGTGPMFPSLKKMAVELGISDKVDFNGFIQDHSDLEKILTKCAIGVAPYIPAEDSFTYFSDPGKPKAYLACGLPVIITDVPAIALTIKNKKAGIMIGYSKEELVKSAALLLSDDRLYEEYRKNAIDFASSFDWSYIFKNAFMDTARLISD